MGAGQIVALPDRDRDGVADERIVALRGLEEAHSLLFYKGALYVAEEHQVIRVRDTDGDLIIRTRRSRPARHSLGGLARYPHPRRRSPQRQNVSVGRLAL